MAPDRIICRGGGWPARAYWGWIPALLLSACVTSGGHKDWGADVTWRPDSGRLRAAALEAAQSPRVWAPLAGAAVFQIDHWDRKVSNWARRNTPVFGSRQTAESWTGYLVDLSTVSYLATVMATPGPSDSRAWFRDKAQGLAVGLGAIAATALTTTALKYGVGRTRPNGLNTQSFPSGDTSHSAVLTALARENLDSVAVSPGVRGTLDVGLDAVTIGTAWSRIEAGAHFPSDTLFSYALGHFASRFFEAAFLGSGSDSRPELTLAPRRHGFELEAAVRW